MSPVVLVKLICMCVQNGKKSLYIGEGAEKFMSWPIPLNLTEPKIVLKHFSTSSTYCVYFRLEALSTFWYCHVFSGLLYLWVKVCNIKDSAYVNTKIEFRHGTLSPLSFNFSIHFIKFFTDISKDYCNF